MPRYRGTIKEHFAMKSKNKGTDGIEFAVDLHYKQQEGEFMPMEPITRRLWLWFPAGKDNEITLKKLSMAGWRGGALSDDALSGTEVEVVSEYETYEGTEREKFDFPLPARAGGERSSDARLAIDTILMAAPAPVAQGNEPSAPEGDGPSDDVPF